MQNLSIIIPHFSKQEALKKTWGELQLQIHPDDEIIIADDWSPDGVPDFDCLCTKVIRPPRREPHIYRLNTLRNYGLEHAAHDFCIILDPDCVPNPHFLDNARKICDASVLFGGRIDRVTEGGEVEVDVRGAKSRWVDSSTSIYGGCMMFSKERTKLIGWFDTDFDGAWGLAEHDFASKCYHSGISLRYSEELRVTHLWHPPSSHEGYGRNRKLWLDKTAQYSQYLNKTTSYDPAVVVLMVSMMRPYYVDQTMRAIFRTPLSLKVRLVNNGDQTEEQLREMAKWSKRWAVDYVNYPSRELLSSIRSECMRDYHSKGYKYMVMLDDDITPMSGSLMALISEMEANKQYHALSGYIVDSGGRKRFIGGAKKNNLHYYYYPVTKQTMAADYTSSGFTIVRLNKVVPYSDGWEMGWNDWDWSNEVERQGLKVGVTGKAGAYHRQIFTPKGVEQKKDLPKYLSIRYDRKRHEYMAELFRQKWGYTPKPARCITEMKAW